MQKASSKYSLFAGTSGWSYASWKPDFYPKTVSAKKFLEYYASQLNTVEVNYTFRALPTHQQMSNWLDAVPEGFRFSFKAPQAITHIRRLKDCAAALSVFLKAIGPARAANKFGCVLFQLPPNFMADNDKLEAFLSLPELEHLPITFEFRHDSWFTQQTYEMLQQHNAAVCVAESEDLVTPESFTADISVYRLRMPGGYAANEVSAFAKKFAALSKKRDVYVYFKHEDKPTGALAATAMLNEARSL